jgi:hypothetical protein
MVFATGLPPVSRHAHILQALMAIFSLPSAKRPLRGFFLNGQMPETVLYCNCLKQLMPMRKRSGHTKERPVGILLAWLNQVSSSYDQIVGSHQ